MSLSGNTLYFLICILKAIIMGTFLTRKNDTAYAIVHAMYTNTSNFRKTLKINCRLKIRYNQFDKACKHQKTF